jgi:hypothetical protein
MIHTHWHIVQFVIPNDWHIVQFVIPNDWLSIAQHDSQPLAQHDSP